MQKRGILVKIAEKKLKTESFGVENKNKKALKFFSRLF
jgi:hypothetical protein